MWFHRVPVDEADERLIDITDTCGNVVTITVRLESHRNGRAIAVCCDDPCRAFVFSPRRRHIVKDLWQHAINLTECERLASEAK